MDRMSAAFYLKKLAQCWNKITSMDQENPLKPALLGLAIGLSLDVTATYLSTQFAPTQTQLDIYDNGNCSRAITASYFIALGGKILAHTAFTLGVICSHGLLQSLWINAKCTAYEFRKKAILPILFEALIMLFCFFTNNLMAAELISKSVISNQSTDIKQIALITCTLNNKPSLPLALYLSSFFLWTLQLIPFLLMYQSLVENPLKNFTAMRQLIQSKESEVSLLPFMAEHQADKTDEEMCLEELHSIFP